MGLRTQNRELSLTLSVRSLILCFLAMSFSIFVNGQGQTRTKKQITKQYFVNGNLRSITETRTTLPRYIDPMNFYKKTKVVVTEYDSVTTKKTREWTRVTKIGKDGKPCYEIYYEEIKYDSLGNRVTYNMSRCDKKKSCFKEYKNGKLVFTRIQKRRKRK